MPAETLDLGVVTVDARSGELYDVGSRSAKLRAKDDDRRIARKPAYVSEVQVQRNKDGVQFCGFSVNDVVSGTSKANLRSVYSLIAEATYGFREPRRE